MPTPAASRLRHLAAIALLFAVHPCVQAQSVFTGPIETTEIASGVHMLTAGSNAVLVIGKESAVLVDGLIAVQAGPLAKRIGELTSLPVRYMIDSHFHGDHTGANVAMRKLGAEIIATEDAARTMARATPSPRGGMNPPVPAEGLPTRTFNGRYAFSIPGARFRLVEMPVSHTDGDAVISLPQSNVLIMGDLHHSHEYPVYDTLIGCQCGSYEGNLEAYRRAMKMANDKTIIVPGHGGVTNKAELAVYVRMLEKVRSDIQALIAAGKSENDVVAAKLLQDDRSVHPGGPDNRDSFVRQLYQALKTGNGA